MSKLIYIETTIPSFYHETRSKPELVAMRHWTREWWLLSKTRDRLVTSDAVLAELDFAPEPKRTECLTMLATLPLLDDRPELEHLRHIHDMLGLPTPILATPFQLLEAEK